MTMLPIHSKSQVILQITQEFFPIMSGPAHVIAALARGFESKGISSPVWTTTPQTKNDQYSSGLQVRYFPATFATTNFRLSMAMMYRLFKIHNVSIIHVHGWRNPISDSAIAAAHYHRIPLVVHAHGVAFGHCHNEEPRIPRLLRSTYDKGARPLVTQLADIIVASTQQEAEELQEYGFPSSRITIVPIGVSDIFFNDYYTVHRVKSDILRLLIVGRLGPRRNIEQALHALAILLNKGIQTTLRVVGPEVKLSSGDAFGYRHKLEDLAQKLGIAHAVTFVGSKYGEELAKEYASADVFIYTTLYENFGLPIAEAAASGLPIVATPTGIAPYFLEGTTSACQVPFHDAYATAQAIQKLNDDYGYRLHCGQIIKQRALNLGWEEIISKYLGIYSAISNNI